MFFVAISVYFVYVLGFCFFRCEHVFLFREKRGQDRAAGAGEDHHTRRESLPRRSLFHGCVFAVFLQVAFLTRRRHTLPRRLDFQGNVLAVFCTRSLFHALPVPLFRQVFLKVFLGFFFVSFFGVVFGGSRASFLEVFGRQDGAKMWPKSFILGYRS